MFLFVAVILYTLVHDSCNKQKALLRFSKAECIRLSMDIEILSVTVELDMVVWFFLYTDTKNIRWRSVHFFQLYFLQYKENTNNITEE